MAYLLQKKQGKEFITMTDVPVKLIPGFTDTISNLTTVEAGRNAEKPKLYIGRLVQTIRNKKGVKIICEARIKIYPIKVVSKKKTGK
jgi:hypothetical protein